jgi:alpha-L-fucosidase
MGIPDWWKQRRFGILFHTDLSAVPAWAPIGQYSEWYRAHIGSDVSDVLLHPSPMAEVLQHHADRWAHIERYDDFLPFLTFDKYDADEWAGLAREAGAGYAVMIAKHHDGLCWWDAPNTDRTVLSDGPARNVLGEFAAACERADIVFGTSYSLLDWGDARYPTRTYVDELVHPHILDLVRRYGSQMLWGDGHWAGGESRWRSDELLAAARSINPEIVINDRWWSDRSGVRTMEYRMPEAALSYPWEYRCGLGAGFGYNRNETTEHLRTAHQMVTLLTEVIAKGGHFLLSVGPDAFGVVPELHTQRLLDIGLWVRAHQRIVDSGQPWVVWGDADCRYLVVDGDLHVIDVTGKGQFNALGKTSGRVTTVATTTGSPIEFEQTDNGLGLILGRHQAASMPTVYRVTIDAPPSQPIELFPHVPARPVELNPLVADAKPGSIVQLADGVYLGPARIPNGVTVRGLGPGRTVIDGLEGCAISLEASSRLEHCAVHGGGERISWLTKPVARLAGTHATMLGCTIDGHVEIGADDCRIRSCVVVGVVATGVNGVTISHTTFKGINWDCAVDINGGSGHLIDSCELERLIAAIRLTGTTSSIVRGNSIHARWWGVQLVDTEGSIVTGNTVGGVTRAVDVDGGTQAEITGNSVTDGDSGCLVQRGASDTSVSGNRWQRCRVGLAVWDAGKVNHHGNTCVDLAETGSAITVGP